jgi:hypothetical protein
VFAAECSIRYLTGSSGDTLLDIGVPADRTFPSSNYLRRCIRSPLASPPQAFLEQRYHRREIRSGTRFIFRSRTGVSVSSIHQPCWNMWLGQSDGGSPAGGPARDLHHDAEQIVCG